MSAPLLIFKAVPSINEQRALITKMMSTKGPLSIKGHEDHYVALTAQYLDEDMRLHCTFDAAPLKFSAGERFTIYFDIGYEKYLFESQPILLDSKIILPVQNFFHLQKRKNFRYSLPPDYAAEFVITHCNNAAHTVRARLIDLSTEGCAVEVAALTSGIDETDYIQAEIHLGDRDPIVVQGDVKNVRVLNAEVVTLGVKFDHMAAESEHKIVTALTNLQRDLYFRKVG